MKRKELTRTIENKELFTTLRDIGVDYGQGYFIARPVPVEKINDELEKIYQNKSIYQHIGKRASKSNDRRNKQNYI